MDELNRTAGMFNGLVHHSRALVRAIFQLSKIHRSKFSPNSSNNSRFCQIYLKKPALSRSPKLIALACRIEGCIILVENDVTHATCSSFQQRYYWSISDLGLYIARQTNPHFHANYNSVMIRIERMKLSNLCRQFVGHNTTHHDMSRLVAAQNDIIKLVYQC